MRMVSALGSGGGISLRGVTAALLALTCLSASVPAFAVSLMSSAEKLHRLDMMLKVSEARCEASGSAFRADYAAFAGSQGATLARADRELRTQLTRRYGSPGGEQAYERMNVALVDEYGKGHPWLGCADLKTAARGLAMVRGSATLIEAADQILPDSSARRFALIRD